MPRIAPLAIAIASFGFAAAAWADVAPDDRKFVESAAAGGMAELELGKVATARASRWDVRQFGQRMVNEHRRANEELKRLAKDKGVALPATLAARHQRDVEEMKKKDAKNFDQAYMEMMVRDHRKVVAEFRKAASSAKDRDIRAFASKWLLAIKDHLQLALEGKAALAKNPGK